MTDGPRDHASRWLLIALCAIFFLSGASALVYQLLWLRLLGLIFGVTVYAASTVWASFMAGLAIGSIVAGRLADRARRPLLWFAAAEAGIAVTGAATTFAFALLQRLYPQLAPALDDSFAQATALRFAVTFLVLILPTGLMGATLPLVVKSSMLRSSTLGASVGALYGSNTSGAIVGALLAGLVLIPTLGMRATFAIAAGINLLAAFCAILVARTQPVSGAAAPATDSTARSVQLLSPWERHVVLATFTVSGAVALALEVVWLRSAIIIAGPTVYTVAVLLATILAGIALGSYCITPFLRRIRRPMLVLAAIEALIAVAILGSLSSLTRTPALADAATVIKALVPPYLVPVVVGAVLVALPASWLMGLAFPLGLQLWTESAGTGSTRQTSRLGAFYALNVCGGIAGSIGAGFVLLPVLGSRSSIVALSAVTMLSAIGLVIVSARSRVVRVVVPAAAAAIFAVLTTRVSDPVATLLALRLPGQPALWREEGIQTTASIHSFAWGTRQSMYLDGYHQAADDGASVLLHYKIGTLPLALHPNPHDALVVGLGGGATAGAMSRHSRLNLDVVELSDTVVRASGFFKRVNFDLLSKPNVHLRLDDGRNYLLSRTRKFDIITADTIQPVRAGSASLYSTEYFTLVRDRLNDDGLAMQWFSGTDAEYRLVVRTFAHVFPYVSVWDNGSLLVGTKMPLRVSADSFNWKLQIPELREALGGIGIQSLDDLRAMLRAAPSDVRRWIDEGPLLSDNRPILEYFLAMPRDKDADLTALTRSVAEVFGDAGPK